MYRQVYSCKKLAIVFASKDSTMAKQFIYAEILNKTSLAMMIRRDFFIYYQVVYLCCISFCFVCVTGYIYFIFAYDLARTFISKKIFQIPLRIKCPSHNQRCKGGPPPPPPFCARLYKLVKRILTKYFQFHPVIFLFTMLCYFRFEFTSRYLLTFLKQNGF